MKLPIRIERALRAIAGLAGEGPADGIGTPAGEDRGMNQPVCIGTASKITNGCPCGGYIDNSGMNYPYVFKMQP